MRNLRMRFLCSPLRYAAGLLYIIVFDIWFVFEDLFPGDDEQTNIADLTESYTWFIGLFCL